MKHVIHLNEFESLEITIEKTATFQDVFKLLESDLNAELDHHKYKLQTNDGRDIDLAANISQSKIKSCSLHPPLIKAMIEKCRMFGVPLREIASKCHADNGVPLVIYICGEFLRKHALDSEGILRVSGSRTRLEEIRKRFDEGEKVDFSADTDINVVAGLFKKFLDLLPEPVCTFSRYNIFLQLRREEDQTPELTQHQVQRLREVIHSLPLHNYRLLTYVIQLANEISQHSDINKMTASNLSIIMGPNIIKGENITIQAQAQDNPTVIHVTELLISHYQQIFDRVISPEEGFLRTCSFQRKLSTKNLKRTNSPPVPSEKDTSKNKARAIYQSSMWKERISREIRKYLKLKLESEWEKNELISENQELVKRIQALTKDNETLRHENTHLRKGSVHVDSLVSNSSDSDYRAKVAQLEVQAQRLEKQLVHSQKLYEHANKKLEEKDGQIYQLLQKKHISELISREGAQPDTLNLEERTAKILEELQMEEQAMEQQLEKEMRQLEGGVPNNTGNPFSQQALRVQIGGTSNGSGENSPKTPTERTAQSPINRPQRSRVVSHHLKNIHAANGGPTSPNVVDAILHQSIGETSTKRTDSDSSMLEKLLQGMN